MFYLYVLKSSVDGSIYIGYTSDLAKRVKEHNDKKSTSTKSKVPWELVYYEAYKSRNDAKHRERQLKRFAQAYKALRQRIKQSVI